MPKQTIAVVERRRLRSHVTTSVATAEESMNDNEAKLSEDIANDEELPSDKDSEPCDLRKKKRKTSKTKKFFGEP